MSNANSDRPKVVFFGMEGNFSFRALSALLANTIEVCAVVMPASPVPGFVTLPMRRKEPAYTPRFVLPLANSGSLYSIAHIAWMQHIPVWEVQSLSHPEIVQMLADYQADLLCVACFSLRIPRALFMLPRLGSLNVHPSLLPANRGPVPLFWTFHEGDAATGVTVHQLNDGLDSGDILAQETIAVPEGIRYADLEALCAQCGGTLLAQTAWKLYEGKITPVPQNELYASYHSFPTQSDFTVEAASWSARHLYNFIRGVGHWDKPIILMAGRQRVGVRDVISYSNVSKRQHSTPAEEGTMDRDMEKKHTLTISCWDGYVRVIPSEM